MAWTHYRDPGAAGRVAVCGVQRPAFLTCRLAEVGCPAYQARASGLPKSAPTQAQARQHRPISNLRKLARMSR